MSSAARFARTSIKKSRTGLLLAERACVICLSIALFSLSKRSISCSSLGHILFPELPQLDRQFDDLVSREDKQNYEHHSSKPEVVLSEIIVPAMTNSGRRIAPTRAAILRILFILQ